MNEQKRTKCDKMRQNNTKKVAKAPWCKDLRWMPWILSQRITNRLTTDSKEQIRSDEIIYHIYVRFGQMQLCVKHLKFRPK